MIALAVVAAALRFPTLGLQSFWTDETVTARLMQLGFGHMLRTIPNSESTPPVYYVVAWGWSRLFGVDEVGLRSLSALAGTAAVPVVYAAAARLFSRRAAVAAGAIVATNPLLVWYSQEARSYALLILVAAGSLVSFARALERPSSRTLALWSTMSVLTVATHYFGVFLIAAEALWLLLACKGRGTQLAVAAAAAGSLALLPLAWAQRQNGNGDWIADQPLRPRVVDAAKEFVVGTRAPYDRPAAVLAAAVLSAAFAVLLLRGEADARRRGAVVLGIGLTAAAIPVALAAVGLDYFDTPNVLAALVPLLIAAAGGFAVLRYGRLPLLGLAFLCAISITLVVAVDRDARYQRADWRGATRALQDAGRTRLLVIEPDLGGWLGRVALQYYLPSARAVDRAVVKPRRLPSLSKRHQDLATADRLTVREIVLVHVGIGGPDRIRAPRPPAPFRLVERRIEVGYALLRYRSSRRTVVSLRSLLPPRTADLDVAILLQARTR